MPVPSFKEVYQLYFEFVWRSARRLGVEVSGMDDLVQEVFMVVHTRMHTLEKPEALRSWIYGVIRRTASNHRRARRANPGALTGDPGCGEATSHEPTPLEQTERNAALHLLTSLLETLPEPKREIFSLVEVDELSVTEAAELLALPLNTAYSRLRSARQAFEIAVARHEARNKGK
ncbi:MAG: sigma-70 family RNA polymerase sigma factor [Polyangiaceae bacterium]